MPRPTVESGERPVIQEPSIQAAFEFKDAYFAKRPEKQGDKRLDGFFTDLTEGRFWSTLTRIDGGTDSMYKQVGYNYVSNEEIAEKVQEARHWAIDNFTPQELVGIFDIYLDQAMNAPVGKVGQAKTPGSFKGNSTAYEQLVENKRSMFAEQVTPETSKILLNFRFWEELPDARVGINSGYSLRALEDMFTNHADELDPEYAKEGFAVLERNRGEYLKPIGIDLHFLSDSALDNYLEFVRKIDARKDELGVTQNQVALLIKEYVDTLVATSPSDSESSRFEDHVDYDHETEENDYVVTPAKKTLERFKDPLVQDYLSHPDTRKSLAESFRYDAEYGTEYDKLLAAQIITIMPNKDQLFRLMSKKSDHELTPIEKLRALVEELTEHQEPTEL